MKKIINFLITVVIAFLIFVLCISFTINDVVINTLSKEVVSNEISDVVISQIENEYDNIDYESLDKIKENINNSSKINELTEKYFNNIVDSIVNDTEVKIPETKDDVLALINENEDILKENNIELTDGQKEKIASELTEDGRLSKVYQNVTESVKEELSSDSVNLIKTYNNITKPAFRCIIIIMIVILTFILALIKKTYYRWTYNLSVSSFISGVLLSFVLPFVLDSIEMDLTNKLLGTASSININMIINAGYICLCVCALFAIIYIVGNKIARYNDRKYD